MNNRNTFIQLQQRRYRLTENKTFLIEDTRISLFRSPLLL